MPCSTPCNPKDHSDKLGFAPRNIGFRRCCIRLGNFWVRGRIRPSIFALPDRFVEHPIPNNHSLCVGRLGCNLQNIGSRCLCTHRSNFFPAHTGRFGRSVLANRDKLRPIRYSPCCPGHTLGFVVLDIVFARVYRHLGNYFVNTLRWHSIAGGGRGPALTTRYKWWSRSDYIPKPNLLRYIVWLPTCIDLYNFSLCCYCFPDCPHRARNCRCGISCAMDRPKSAHATDRSYRPKTAIVRCIVFGGKAGCRFVVRDNRLAEVGLYTPDPSDRLVLAIENNRNSHCFGTTSGHFVCSRSPRVGIPMCNIFDRSNNPPTRPTKKSQVVPSSTTNAMS